MSPHSAKTITNPPTDFKANWLKFASFISYDGRPCGVNIVGIGEIGILEADNAVSMAFGAAKDAKLKGSPPPACWCRRDTVKLSELKKII